MKTYLHDYSGTMKMTISCCACNVILFRAQNQKMTLTFSTKALKHWSAKALKYWSNDHKTLKMLTFIDLILRNKLHKKVALFAVLSLITNIRKCIAIDFKLIKCLKLH